MKMLAFARRTGKEILRDPLTVLFGLGFPVILILLLSAIQASIPVPLFEPDRLTPGITVFGLAFMTLFSATLIARDRESALLERLYTTPLTAGDYIMGYALPIFPIAAAQCVICYAIAALLGLRLTVNTVYAVLFMLPVSVFFIALGLLCGSVMNVKQVGGICGALLTNLTACGLILILWGELSEKLPMRCPLFMRWSWNERCLRAILPGYFRIYGGCWDMRRRPPCLRCFCFCGR